MDEYRRLDQSSFAGWLFNRGRICGATFVRRAQFPAGLPSVGANDDPLVPVVGPLPVGCAPKPVSLGTITPLRLEGTGGGNPPSGVADRLGVWGVGVVPAAGLQATLKEQTIAHKAKDNVRMAIGLSVVVIILNWERPSCW